MTRLHVLKCQHVMQSETSYGWGDEMECGCPAEFFCDECGKPLCDKHLFYYRGMGLCYDCHFDAIWGVSVIAQRITRHAVAN